MSIIGGPLAAPLIVIVLIVALGVWLIQRRPYRDTQRFSHEEIDREELEAAEREVRDLDLNQQPDDDFEGNDWGPGASRRPRSPLEL